MVRRTRPARAPEDMGENVLVTSWNWVYHSDFAPF